MVKTDWVTGDKHRLIELTLNGLQGEIEVNGEKYNGAMPPHSFLSDEDLASVLTYIRSNFGNQVDAVEQIEVSRVRAE